MSSENQHATTSEDSHTNLPQERLDYAWKWFDYHARQRVSMFNFFLIASGLLATAYVSALSEDNEVLAAVLSFIGAMIAFGFVVLDCRNATLVYLGEDVLPRLERDYLFKGFKGLKEVLTEADAEGILYRDATETRKWWQRCSKHRCCLKFIEVLVAIGFLVGGVYAIVRCFDP
jgi:hypothetical protein